MVEHKSNKPKSILKWLEAKYKEPKIQIQKFEMVDPDSQEGQQTIPGWLAFIFVTIFVSLMVWAAW